MQKFALGVVLCEEHIKATNSQIPSKLVVESKIQYTAAK
jgi:hypothetical protein